MVEGAATGAGCLLALACDNQLVARSALVGMPVVRLGILLSPAFATRLSLRVGPARAKELLYTGRVLGADEAAAVGLVGRVVDDGSLESELATVLDAWRAQPVTALRGREAGGRHRSGPAHRGRAESSGRPVQRPPGDDPPGA